MRKPEKTKPRTPKKPATPKQATQKAAPPKAAPNKAAPNKQVVATPKPPVAVAPQAPANRFTLSSTSARQIEKELDRLFETLPELRTTAPRWAEMVESDDEEACYGCIAIGAAGVLYAVAREDDNEALSDLDYNDDEYPAWLTALVRLHKHGDIHPWGNPTLQMLEWAKRVIKVRPAPDGEVAFDELCETMGIDVR